MAEVVYVSWGGTGRAATFRAALAEVADRNEDLVYLAVLDDSTFADVDKATLALAVDELSWLLDAQAELTQSQLGAEDVKIRILVKAGDVADIVAEVTETAGATEVLVGAPVPLANHDSVEDLIENLNSRIDPPVRLISPDTGRLPEQ